MTIRKKWKNVVKIIEKIEKSENKGIGQKNDRK